MKKIINILLFAILLTFSGNAQVVIESDLQEAINQRSDELISINILLKSQIETAELRDMAVRANDIEAKKELIVEGLKKYSKKEQSEILSILKSEKRGNNVSDISCHWLVNSINCKASRDVIFLLSEHPDVAMIGLNERENLLEGVTSEEVPTTRGIGKHIKKVGADKVWSLGYTGKGVVVAVLDTGTNFDHTDISSENLWDGGSEYPFHGYNFINPILAPYDDNGHGSHCAGIICGNGASGTQTGIAPDVKLMTVKVLDHDGYCTLEDMTKGIEFAVENGADVLSISAGWSEPKTSLSVTFRHIFTNTLELGVIASVAAGNDKGNLMFYPVPGNINAPGNCPPAWIHPDQMSNAGGLSGIISVGAVEDNNTPANFSSVGPVTWQDSEWSDYQYNPGIGLIRPDICAPGVDIFSLSHSKYDAYVKQSGTSMATPCVAGIIALLLEKNPHYTPSDICRILETTATKITEEKSNYTGSGVVNALAAINEGNNIPYIEYVSCNPEVTLSGDDIELTVKVTNNGEVATTADTRLFISTDDTYVSVTNDEVLLGVIECREIAEGTFKVKISQDAPSGHIVNFNITAKCNNNGEEISFHDSFTIEINTSSSVRFMSCSPAELSTFDLCELDITMFNNGNVATTNNSLVILSTNDQYLTIVNNQATYGPMEVGEGSTGTFSIIASPITPDGHYFDFNLKAILEGSKVLSNITYDFEDNTTNEWTAIDADGDGFNWIESGILLGSGYGRDGSDYCMFSQSFDNSYGKIEPDNYLVSPTKFTIEENTVFSFWACAQDMDYPEEHFGVAISEKGNILASDFTTIAEWTLTAKSGNTRAQGQWYHYTVDLSEYVGKEIWLAIRHFDCVDQYFLAIDDIELSNIYQPLSWNSSFSMKFNSMSPHITFNSCTPEVLYSGDNDINISVINKGSAELTKEVNMILSTDDSFVTINDNTISYPPMQVDEAVSMTYNINVNPDAPHGQVVKFKLEGFPNKDYSQEENILFNFNNDMNGWTTINANNDSHTWYHTTNTDPHDAIAAPSHSGGEHIMSESFCNATMQPFSPDDYAVAPMMIEVTENTTVNFWACAQDEDFAGEHFGVAISTASNDNAEDFTTIAEWTMTAKSGQGNATRSTNGTRYGKWYQYSVDLKEYAGEKIWVAIRHFDSFNNFALCVDDVEINNYIKVYDWSSTFSMTISNEDNIAPTNLKAKVLDESSIELKWGSVENASTYNVYRNNEFLVSVESNNHLDYGLEQNTEYCYTVTCVINDEESKHSNVACGTTLSNIITCYPASNVQAIVEEDVPGWPFKYQITLTWDKIDNAMSYSIYANNNFIATETTNSFITGSDLPGEITYNIMTNCGDDGYSTLSEDIIVTIVSQDDEPCLSPDNLKVEYKADVTYFEYKYMVTATWDKVDNAESYNVYIDGELFGDNITSTSYVVGTDNVGTYTFAVSADCENGESEKSEEISLTITDTSIEEYESRLNIFPNPVDDKLYLTTDDVIREVNIFDITGIQVYKDNNLNNNEINVSNLNSGIYIIKIETNNNNIIKRFIKK